MVDSFKNNGQDPYVSTELCDLYTRFNVDLLFYRKELVEGSTVGLLHRWNRV